MEREEFKILVKAMKAVYSTDNFIADKDAFNVWFELLKDLSYEQANLAIQKYMLTEKFPPTIADIRTKVNEIIAPAEESMSELQAWQLVYKAIGRSVYYAEEEFEKLPKACKIAVGQAAVLREWATMDNFDKHISVEQSHFINAYRAAQNRIKEEAKLPDNLRLLIADMGQKRAAQIAQNAPPVIEDKSEEVPLVHTGTEIPPELKEKLQQIYNDFGK